MDPPPTGANSTRDTARPCATRASTRPALLAESEAGGASVGEVLRCTVLAFEVTVRIARDSEFPPLVLHPHGIFNSVGAATAVIDSVLSG